MVLHGLEKYCHKIKKGLKLLVEYVIKVYVRSCFEIKKLQDQRIEQVIFTKWSLVPHKFKTICSHWITLFTYFFSEPFILLGQMDYTWMSKMKCSSKTMQEIEWQHIPEFGLRIPKTRKSNRRGKYVIFNFPIWILNQTGISSCLTGTIS